MSKHKNYQNFKDCVCDLLSLEDVLSMRHVKQHVSVTCLEHSLFVSYISFRVCRFLRWDYVAAARGGLLHDLFTDNKKESHLRTHPADALKNASRICELTDREKDIIVKHMWPLTFKLPKYKESFAVNIIDTACAFMEVLFIFKRMGIRNNLRSIAAI